MFELIAEGPEPRQYWKNALSGDGSYTLGRTEEADLSVPWDPHISRWHARLTTSANCIDIEKLSGATNLIFFDGQQVNSCRVHDDQQFVLGSTLFRVVLSRQPPLPQDAALVEKLTFSRQQLQKIRFHDADKQIDVLTHLPEVIWGSRTDFELYHRLVNLLLAGVAHAEAVAIVKLDDDNLMRVLHWDRRHETAGKFRPSERLVAEAIKKRGSSVLHIWESQEQPNAEYTAMAEFDWAFCTPVSEPVGDSWGLYVAGRLDRPFVKEPSTDTDSVSLQGDVKFTELVSEIISSVRRLNKLERQQAGLRQFFAPTILSALGDELNTDLLEPRECDVTVMFCDLRGFSQQAEILADDLIGLLNRVSNALGVMTHHILAHGGVTGDFQGDAALGFWGWPFASDEAPLNACRAALGIRAEFARAIQTAGHALANFQMGIGIAHGNAVAGKIGTVDQVKVTVFGPVVNLASRLESMTSQLRVPILLDEATAEIVRHKLDRREGRTRRLAKVLPIGIETPTIVSELLPPESEWPELTDAHLEQYELGVKHFIDGHWEDAYHHLHNMPPYDRAQDFLTMLIAQNNRIAPPDWDGVVRLSAK